MAKFVNVAHADAANPSLVNVDDIVRIRPGLINSNWSGKDETCTIYLRMTMDEEYENNLVLNEPLTIEVYLTTKEICRRMRNDVFTV